MHLKKPSFANTRSQTFNPELKIALQKTLPNLPPPPFPHNTLFGLVPGVRAAKTCRAVERFTS